MAVEREVDETCLPACSASFEDSTAAAEIDDNVDAKSAPLMSNVSLCSNDDDKFDCKALLDTGAVRCFIKKTFLDSLPSEYVLARKSGSYSVTVADNRRFNSDESVLLKIATPQKTVSSWCIVYPSLAFPLILGLSCMRDLSLLLYLSHDQILLRADTLESDVRSLASKKDSDGVEGSQKAGCTKPSDNDSSARYHNESELTIDGYNAKDGVSGEEGSHLSFLMVDANHSDVWELDATDPWNVGISIRSPDYSSRDYFLSVVDSEDPASSDYNVTVYKGLTSDSHIDEHGSVIDVKRFTYGIPWVSEKRPPKPTVGDIDKVVASDSRLAKRLQDSGLFDKYSKVFDEYVRRNILVKVDPSDYHKVTGIIPHYPIISTTSKSTPVRPVLRGSQYRNIIGSGLGAVKSPRDAILRSTMPSILTFRAFSHVAVLDLEKAFYMLRNSVDVAFLFCLPWKGALYRMTAPPMGAPHSAAALLHAMRLMCDEAYQLFKSRHPEIPDGECCVAFSPYMDDLIVGAASQSLLVEAIDCLLMVCKSHGFNCQESKRGVGPPTLKPRKVLGLLWHPDDKVGNQEGPLLPPILRSEECAKSIVSLTQRDVVSWIAKFYDPCGISNHILLSMRLCLRGEANTNPDVDAFISASTFKSLKELMESFRQAPPIPRLLTILPYRIVYCFADSSVYATANVITDSVLNPIVCHSRLIDRNRMNWTIVRKELLACLQVLHSFRDMMKALNSILPDVKIHPTLFTDNEANYFRIRKAVALFPDVEPLLKDMPKWEVNTLSAIAETLSYFDGSVHHVAGKLNLSDVFSRGSAQPPPFLDQSLLETIHNACRRRESSAQSPNITDDSKNCGRDDYLLILDDAISDDLKNKILREQRLDPIFRPFFDQSGPISPRVLRKYELVDAADDDDDNDQSYVRNRVTGAIVVPSKLCKEVAEVLHNYFGHINHYRLFRTVIDRYDCGKVRLFRSIEHRCPICICQRGGRTRRHQLGRKLLRSTRVWEIAGVDLIGPHSQPGIRSADHDSIMALICVDSYSGFTVHRVIREHCTAGLLVEALSSIMLEHGYVMGILSDSDPRYNSSEVVAWTKATGIRWCRCPAHTSYLSGWHESKHASINRILRALLQKSGSPGLQADWYRLLPHAVYLCNNVCRPSLGSSLFAADGHYIYGRALPPILCPLRTMSREGKQSLDDMIPLPIPTTREVTQLLWEYSQTVTDTHQWIVENLETALRSRDVYNATQMMRSDFNRLNVGDKVVRYNFDCLTHKLSQRWLSDIYVVVGIRGVIAAIAISPTDNNVKYEYIGNLKKVMDDEDNED